MEKKVDKWSIRTLEELVNLIHFPEYQREPNLWSRTAKQRLIDSISRQFDIASLYFYEHEDGRIDCVDGRQRIGAIMEFLGHRPGSDDNKFPFRVLNEIEEDDAAQFKALDGKTKEQIESESEAGDALAATFLESLMDYKVAVVNLAGGEAEGTEFNLQFTRLNLGTLINSGEKLNAMAGDLRNLCFKEGGLGSHPFLAETGIPTRRYAKEQVAAQIVAQVFALAATGEYARTRHYDLQGLFKENAQLDAARNEILQKLSAVLDALSEGFGGAADLKSRAMVVSTVVLASELGITGKGRAAVLADFIEELQCRVKWQMGKGLDVDPEYRYLVDFQRHVTQASVEKPAVAERARVMKQQYEQWLDSETLEGDEEWQQRTGGNPSEECRK